MKTFNKIFCRLSCILDHPGQQEAEDKEHPQTPHSQQPRHHLEVQIENSQHQQL